MAEVKLYNLKGDAVGTLPLPAELFDVVVKPAVVHDVIVAQDANSRAVIAHVKGRGEVRGGGKKPWKQKGTGRARHGSSRSPIWVGGGVTHGPNAERNFSVKVNKKAKRSALAMVLTDKVKNNMFVAVEDFFIPEAKTKFAASMRAALPGADAKAIIVVTVGDANMKRALKNLPKTTSIHAHSVNARDLARVPFVLASKAAIEAMAETFST